MDAQELIKGRRSIRKFKDKKVDRELIQEIIELSRFAPSWTNAQIARYYVIDEKQKLKELAEKTLYGFQHNLDIISSAAGAVIISYKKGKSGNLSKYNIVDNYSKFNTWEEFDSGIACQTLCLSAHLKGVGTCIFGVINKAAIADFLKLPDNQRVSVMVVYGYPDEKKSAPPRKEVNDILKFID